MKGDDWSIVWLGDDDAMSPNHLDLLENEARKRSEPFIYTMPRLQRVTLDAERNIVKGSIWECPNVHGLALSGVRVNPIRLGAHYNIEKNHLTLLSLRILTIWGVCCFCDKQHTASRRDLQVFQHKATLKHAPGRGEFLFAVQQETDFTHLIEYGGLGISEKCSRGYPAKRYSHLQPRDLLRVGSNVSRDHRSLTRHYRHPALRAPLTAVHK